MTFDANDALEKTSENMEGMTALMDKMYIKLEQKDVPYKPQIYQRGRGQNQRQISRRNNWRGCRPFSRNHNEGNRGYGWGRGNFQERIIFSRKSITSEVDIVIIEWIGIGKIGEYADNPGQEKEIEIDRSWSPSSSRSGSRTSTNRDRIRYVSNVENMTTSQMNALI